MNVEFTNLLLIDIDGLRNDVFLQALAEERIPNIARLLGGHSLARALHLPLTAPAPSITFCAQASLFTGAHPNQHGIPGNQFFDRCGRYGNGTPRFYAFDVGGTLAFDDAIRVFTSELAANCLQRPTLYQTLAERGWRSVVSGNMYGNGAESWLVPSVVDLGRFLKGGPVVGMSSAQFDRKMLDRTLAYLNREPLPQVLTLYFMGVDVESHEHGPGTQLGYLVEEVDPMIGELWQAYSAKIDSGQPLVALFSDHGQIEVVHDDRHSLQLAFPFELELAPLFSELGIDVHDHPSEAPRADAVVALNGGLAFVYLRRRGGEWSDVPRFAQELLPVARAFWEAHSSGAHAPDVEGALAGVLLRNAEADGWDAPYVALTPAGEIVPLDAWFAAQPDGLYRDPVNRLNGLAGEMTGDLLLISNYADGFYFGAQKTGMHGGLHPDDSTGVLAYGFPGLEPAVAQATAQTIAAAIESRCAAEGHRLPAMVDMTTGLFAVL